jgi:hypothetical protein
MAVPRQFAHKVAKPRRRRDARDVGGDESPWNPSTLRADVLRTRSGGGEDQIDAVDLVRRHQAVQIRRISSPEMAGDGRRISAKAAATTASRERGEELGFLREERGEAEWADRAQRVARVRPNPLGHLTGGAQGYFSLFTNQQIHETLKFNRKLIKALKNTLKI